MLATIAVLGLLGPAPDDAPKGGGPPSKEELAAIAERGRGLAAYDRAVACANDAVFALMPAGRDIARQVARRTNKGWVVAFGRLDKGRSTFLIAYEATEAGPERFTAAKLDPPRASTGFELHASLAMDAALTDFLRATPERRPYNVAALPAEGGKLWVYLVPAPTKPGVWPLGGDVRYLVAGDGSTILAKRQLHASILEVAPSKDRPGPGAHAHVLSDRPEDTDVAHVLAREPRTAEVVSTPAYIFTIKPDGSIEFAGKSKGPLKP
jgi:hypothetical protein